MSRELHAVECKMMRKVNTELKPEKLNCWEYHQCGREVGGAHVSELGICPASIELRLEGIHGGINGGRSCWIVAGTMGRREATGVVAEKIRNCEACSFYQKVKEEESQNFLFSESLLNKIEGF